MSDQRDMHVNADGLPRLPGDVFIIWPAGTRGGTLQNFAFKVSNVHSYLLSAVKDLALYWARCPAETLSLRQESRGKDEPIAPPSFSIAVIEKEADSYPTTAAKGSRLKQLFEEKPVSTWYIILLYL